MVSIVVELLEYCYRRNEMSDRKYSCSQCGAEGTAEEVQKWRKPRSDDPVKVLGLWFCTEECYRKALAEGEKAGRSKESKKDSKKKDKEEQESTGEYSADAEEQEEQE